MIIIGLTGSIASGKSTVAAMLMKANIPVIDADLLAREVTDKNSEGLKEIVREFGSSILTANQSLDRQKLGAIVFADPMRRKKLEAIVHPRVEQRRFEIIYELEQAGHKLVVYMAPLIFEAGLHKHLTKTILVTAPIDTITHRIMKRDNLSESDAQKRIRAQLDDETKISMADAVIINDGTLDELYENTATAWENITGFKLGYAPHD